MQPLTSTDEAMIPALDPAHLLAQPRPEGPLLAGVPDTTTLAAHDFDVDTRTGFMPPEPPMTRLPVEWELWEQTLDIAVEKRLQLGSKADLTEKEAAVSLGWRKLVQQVPVLSTDNLNKSETVLRRAHLVLAWIMHFYIHSIPPTGAIKVPRGVTIPLLQICNQLQLPPVLTYSDDVLYNWMLKDETLTVLDEDGLIAAPALENLRSHTTFTGTRDEEEFYLASARIELRGVEVLELMRETMDEAFVGDDIALRRIASYLHSMASVIDELSALLMGVRQGCNPDVFCYNIRPWFKGQDSDPNGRVWEFEGIEEDPMITQPKELSGPSAGQSSLIHALDIFLGIEHGSTPSSKQWFERMQRYMPRHHRNFLRHLSSNPRPLRALVESSGDAELEEEYNLAVTALKGFRDAHVKIVAIYIVGPSRRVAPVAVAKETLKGTGGTDMMKFVKSTRDATANTVLP